MTPTPTPGPELPSTLGGAGWQARSEPHSADLGTIWAGHRVSSHFAPIRAVLLADPGDEQLYTEPPAEWLMYERPDLPTLRAQAQAIAALYRSQGAEVFWSHPSRPKPNHLFMCDLFFMTPEGAILARMAARQRAGEERGTAEALAAMGVPILLTPRGNAYFEGADAMWLDERTVLIGIGKRSNHEAVRQITPVLADMGVRVEVATVGRGVQHLLGVINPIRPGLAAILAPHATASLREAMSGWELIELGSDDETEGRRAMNFVPLRPGAIVMPANCPRTREIYERHGVECHEVEVSEYIKAGGALGCLTGVLGR